MRRLRRGKVFKTCTIPTTRGCRVQCRSWRSGPRQRTMSPLLCVPLCQFLSAVMANIVKRKRLLDLIECVPACQRADFERDLNDMRQADHALFHCLQSPCALGKLPARDFSIACYHADSACALCAIWGTWYAPIPPEWQVPAPLRHPCPCTERVRTHTDASWRTQTRPTSIQQFTGVRLTCRRSRT